MNRGIERERKEKLREGKKRKEENKDEMKKKTSMQTFDVSFFHASEERRGFTLLVIFHIFHIQYYIRRKG